MPDWASTLKNSSNFMAIVSMVLVNFSQYSSFTKETNHGSILFPAFSTVSPGGNDSQCGHRGTADAGG
jgi:hypothetical protein